MNSKQHTDCFWSVGYDLEFFHNFGRNDGNLEMAVRQNRWVILSSAVSLTLTAA
jgi:hypothetical protein